MNSLYDESLQNGIGLENEDDMVMAVQNEEIIGSFMGSSGTSLSVAGLYATVVIALGRFLRIMFDRIS